MYLGALQPQSPYRAIIYCFKTHTHTFNGPFSGTTRVSRYQKGKTNLDLTEVRDSEWQWHQLGHMQVCTLLQTDNHASTPPLVFYRPDALPNQQRQSTKGKIMLQKWKVKYAYNTWHPLKKHLLVFCYFASSCCNWTWYWCNITVQNSSKMTQYSWCCQYVTNVSLQM